MADSVGGQGIHCHVSPQLLPITSSSAFIRTPRSPALLSLPLLASPVSSNPLSITLAHSMAQALNDSSQLSWKISLIEALPPGGSVTVLPCAWVPSAQHHWENTEELGTGTLCITSSRISWSSGQGGGARLKSQHSGD